MICTRILAGVTLAAVTLLAVPAAPARADGAASTRNILLLGAAATYLIVQHNRQVHAKYAADAQRQAATAQQANDAWAAYAAEKRAYNERVAVNADLKKEIAYQHNVVTSQKKQMATTGSPGFAQTAAIPKRTTARTSTKQVAMVSYGWGTL